MFKGFLKATLEVQLAITCSVFSLLGGLILTFLASVSSFYLQKESIDFLGQGLADQLSRQIMESIETGDLIDLVGSLQAFTSDSSATVALVYDIEENILASSGKFTDGFHQYTAPILIGKDLAGSVVIEINASRNDLLQFRFVVSLMGLAIFFSIVIFFATKKLSLFITRRLRYAAEQLEINEKNHPKENNVLVELEKQIESLPISLLKCPITTNSADRLDKKIAILYLNIHSLQKYLKTLDEVSLRAYIEPIKQIISYAADFYGGDTRAVRLFGSAIFFDEQDQDLSASFRAISCGQLIRSVQQEVGEKMDLSIQIRMAADLCQMVSEGNQDIYGEIHIQTCLNKLQQQCEKSEEELVLSEKLLADSEAKIALELSRESDCQNGFLPAGYFDAPELDLIDRQRWLIIRKIGILD